MPTIIIIKSIMTDLVRYLSLSQVWFTKNPLPSIIYGIGMMIIQTGDILKEAIEKKNPLILHKGENKYNVNMNPDVIIYDLYQDILLQSTVIEAAIKVINTTIKLKNIFETENMFINQNGGDIFNEGRELTFVLIRKGERKYYNFPEQLTQILWTNSKIKIHALNLEDLQDDDGFTYYLQATTYEWNPKITAIQLSKKEAVFLAKRIDEVNDINYGMVSI